MKVILQAIKSLFNKTKIIIDKNIESVREDIAEIDYDFKTFKNNAFEIVDVLELPNSPDKDCIYRLTSNAYAVIYEKVDGVYGHFVNENHVVHLVEAYPIEPDPYEDGGVYNYYYNVKSNEVKICKPDGWVKYTKKTVVQNASKGEFIAFEDYIVLCTKAYVYKDGWVMLDSAFIDGGTGEYSNVLNDVETNIASGGYSYAEGSKTTASGNYSHAEGWSTTASGEYSHAEGCVTTASGYYSHAEGSGTTASGVNSHAEGYRTTASGDYSHAEGNNSHAEGDSSHAEGYFTTASGDHQHVQGKYNVAASDSKYAHIVGNGTPFERSNAHTLDWSGNAWFQGDVYVGGTSQDNGERLARLSDIPTGGGGDSSSPAIIDVVELPTENIQEDKFYRLLTGSLVICREPQNTFTVHCVETLPESGLPATNADQSEGNVYYNLADGEAYGFVDDILSAGLGVPSGWYPAATLIGALGFTYAGVITDITDDPSDGAFRLLLESVVWQYKDKWTSMKSVGWGGEGNGSEIFNRRSNSATGHYSHAEGYDTIASGDYSHAEGMSSEAIGECSHAEGCDTTASGHNSHAEGTHTFASGDYSHAEGSYTTASGHKSHAEGFHTIASGNQSHAEGFYSTASGHYSHAESGSIASGDYSHAEGMSSEAIGDCSHAEGFCTIASGADQHVQGSYNIDDPDSKYAHIVGNGDSKENRSNAHTLDWNGLGWFAGGLKVGGTGQDDENAVAVLTTKDLENLPTGGVTSWNDLEDKPFGAEIAEMVLFDGTVTDGDTLDTESLLELGKEYIVEYDGSVYNLVAFDDEGFITIGAPYSGFHDYAFSVCIDGEQLYVALADGDDHSLCISTMMEIISPIDEKYLPDTVTSINDIVTVRISEDTMMLDHTPDEIEAMYNKGKMVLCKNTGTTFDIRRSNEDVTATVSAVRMSQKDGVVFESLVFDANGLLISADRYLLTAAKQ